jgi:SAM-dependent methyltransferase
MNPFDRMYEGTPPWEIGRPQPVVERLLAEGSIDGEVLDVGCGTGENAMLLAARGHAVVGVDVASRAIAIARIKATQRRLSVRFLEHDALGLAELDRKFDTILDSALFHVFSDDARAADLAALEAVARPGTSLHLVCFSEREPEWGGPRRVRADEIREAFAQKWIVERLEPARYQHVGASDGARAHLATLVFAGAKLGARA